MVNRTLKRAANTFWSSASLHHRRKDEESSRVYRHPHQDKYRKHQADSDEYSAQRAAVGRVVDPTVWGNFVHDEGLPRRRYCHTWLATGHWNADG